MKKKIKNCKQQNQDSCKLYFLQLKQLTKDLSNIGDRIVNSGIEITEDILIQYDNLQDDLSNVSKTVNDVNYSGCPDWMLGALDNEISELAVCIRIFGSKVNRKGGR